MGRKAYGVRVGVGVRGPGQESKAGKNMEVEYESRNQTVGNSNYNGQHV